MKIIIEGSAEEIKEYRDLIGNEVTVEIKEDETSFKVGDTVKALADGQFENIYAGDIGVVSNCYMGSATDPFSIRVVTKSDDCDYFRPRDLELVEDESYKPTKGDIVVITANTNDSRNKVGDIGKVGRMMDDMAKVDVPNRPSKAGEYGNWTSFSEMRPATEEEKAQYEQAVKLAKFGRQPNEFKKGDIVRFNRDTGAEGFREGSIAEIETEVVGKDFEFGNGYSGHTDWIELVAPVEARVDR